MAYFNLSSNRLENYDAINIDISNSIESESKFDKPLENEKESL